MVLDEICEQIANGQSSIMGVMVESHLVAGKQKFPQPLEDLVYGQSITDACVDLTNHRIHAAQTRRSGQAAAPVASGAF